MKRAMFLSGYCTISVLLLFSWILLIGACSRSSVTPVQADRPAVSSQNPVTSVQADKPAAVSPDVATPAQANSTIAMRNCSDKDQDGELTGWQRLIKEEDELYLYAVKLFNQPVSCKGKAEADPDGLRVGTIVFTFAGGATFSIEALPPESSITILRAPGGFSDEKEVRSILEQYTQKVGVHIEWSKPKEEHHEGDEQIFTYWDPDEGLNAGGDLIYKNKKLVGISFHMAL